MTDIEQSTQAEIEKICQEAGILSLALFGSQARGDVKRDSDVDLLVEFKETPGLIRFIHTKQQFEKIFKKKVDLVTKDSLSKYIKPFVQKDLYQLYG